MVSVEEHRTTLICGIVPTLLVLGLGGTDIAPRTAATVMLRLVPGGVPVFRFLEASPKGADGKLRI